MKGTGQGGGCPDDWGVSTLVGNGAKHWHREPRRGKEQVSGKVIHLIWAE